MESRRILISAIENYKKIKASNVSNYSQIKEHFKKGHPFGHRKYQYAASWGFADNQAWLLRAGE
jgi:hypothetical protein